MTEFAVGRDGATTTEPNSAALLALGSLAYWPPAAAGPRAPRPQADGPPAMAVGRSEEEFA